MTVTEEATSPVTKDTTIPVRLSVADWGKLGACIVGLAVAQTWTVSQWISRSEAQAQAALDAADHAQQTADAASAELAKTKEVWQQTLMKIAADVGELKGLVAAKSHDSAK